MGGDDGYRVLEAAGIPAWDDEADVVVVGYGAAGGRVQMEMLEGSGHGPLFDAAERWGALFFGFLASVE